MIVAIEGIDGSGKGTQAQLLRKQFEDDKGGTLSKVLVSSFSFPGYEKNIFGQAVGDYLHGKFGTLDQIHPKLAAMLYAADRYATDWEIREANNKRPNTPRRHLYNNLVIIDRYMASNVAHQAARIPAGEEREAFIDWLEEVETSQFRIMPPDHTIYLSISLETAAKNVLQKKARVYTDKAADLHEADQAYMANVKAVYDELRDLHSDSWITIPCEHMGVQRPAEEISDDIYEAVIGHL